MSLRDNILATGNDTAERDGIVLRAVQEGNVPSWVKTGWTSKTIVDAAGKLEMFFMRDALAIGSDAAPLYVPVSIRTAQKVADALNAIILTPKLIDDVFADTRTQRIPFQGFSGLFKDKAKQAADKAFMQSSDAMLQHSDKINALVDKARPLVMGHSKCLAIGPNLSRLGIYGGWGGPVHGWAIQGYPGPHNESWVDYSQQLNLVSRVCVFDGVISNLGSLFTDPKTAHLVTYTEAFSPTWPTGPGAGGSGATPPGPPKGPTSMRSFDTPVPGVAEGVFTTLTLGAPWPGEFARAYAQWFAGKIIQAKR